MPALVLKSYEQILQAMINHVVAQSDLSDVNDASQFKHLLSGPAREMDEIYFQMGSMRDLFSLDAAQGDDLDARAQEIQPALLTRIAATKATGFVVFSRAVTSGTVNIPAGTVVKTADGKEFETTAVGTILDTFSVSADVPIIAKVAGADGNVVASTIIKFDNKPTGVDSVTNNADTNFGTDEESDDAFRDRIREFISSLARCTPEALEFIAKTVELSTGQRVIFAKVVEDLINRGEVILYVDNGQGTAESFTEVLGENVTEGLSGPPPDSAVGGEEFLFLDQKPIRRVGPTPLSILSSVRGPLTDGVEVTVNDADGQLFFDPPLVTGEIITASYTAFDGLLAAVQKVIDGDPNDRVNFPGWRAAGVRVLTAVPQILIVQVVANLVITEGFADAAVQTEVRDALLEYINNLGISGDVIRNRLIEVMMSVPGVENLTLTDPLTDIIMLDDQLPRTTILNIALT